MGGCLSRPFFGNGNGILGGMSEVAQLGIDLGGDRRFEIKEAPEEKVVRLDGWETRSSKIFKGFVEIVKDRKDGDPLSIHVNLDTGRVRKCAGNSLFNSRVEKEIGMWRKALDLFGVEENVEKGSVRELKEDPSRGYEVVEFLDMPYMGLPLNHYRAKVSRKSQRKQNLSLEIEWKRW